MAVQFKGIWNAQGDLLDVLADLGGREIPLLGSAGPERERAVLRVAEAEQLGSGDFLPVLVGSGMGHALEELLARTNGPVAVVDAEAHVLGLTGLREKFADPRILWVTPRDQEEDVPCGPAAFTPDAALAALSLWQDTKNGKPFLPFVNPWYLRLNREWYDTVRTHLVASARYNFWEKAVQPRFQGRHPRLLLITSKYFLMGEIVGACKRLGYPVRLLTLENMEVGGADFVRRLLEDVLTFKPDFVLTLNHLGIDREGVLAQLLTRLRLPLASWFVDNPNLILHLYKGLAGPWTTLFTWDADNVEGLRTHGYPHVHHLPLGTDPDRFRPRTDGAELPPDLRARVCFVGNSMVYKVGARLQKSALPAALLRGYRRTAAEFGASSERSARAFVLGRPDLAQAFTALDDLEDQLAFETLLTWEATRQYRAECVRHILPFTPLIVGDRGWNILFRERQEPWRLHPEVNYYSELPLIYPACEINFNCTSKQMKGAVNQRLFDVPAAGGFLLTDMREQLSELFDPGREVVCYTEPEEATDLVQYYLDHPGARRGVVEAARRRVLAEHTWAHRVKKLVDVMRRTYAG